MLWWKESRQKRHFWKVSTSWISMCVYLKKDAYDAVCHKAQFCVPQNSDLCATKLSFVCLCHFYAILTIWEELELAARSRWLLNTLNNTDLWLFKQVWRHIICFSAYLLMNILIEMTFYSAMLNLTKCMLYRMKTYCLTLNCLSFFNSFTCRTITNWPMFS